MSVSLGTHSYFRDAEGVHKVHALRVEYINACIHVYACHLKHWNPQLLPWCRGGAWSTHPVWYVYICVHTCVFMCVVVCIYVHVVYICLCLCVYMCRWCTYLYIYSCLYICTGGIQSICEGGGLRVNVLIYIYWMVHYTLSIFSILALIPQLAALNSNSMGTHVTWLGSHDAAMYRLMISKTRSRVDGNRERQHTQRQTCIQT